MNNTSRKKFYSYIKNGIKIFELCEIDCTIHKLLNFLLHLIKTASYQLPIDLSLK